MKEIVKKYLPDVIVVVVFALMSFAYFYPADTQNRVLYRHDSAANKGVSKETGDYRIKTGEISRWTDAVFSGMPTYQISPEYSSQKPLDVMVKWYHLGLPNYVWYLFAYFLGFYILLRAFDFKWHLAVLGSIIWALSSYFLIIIAAGHYWKVMALAYLPPMIGGIVMTYRGKMLWGFIVTAIFAGMEIYANHPQMTYYYAFIIVMMVLAFLYQAIREKKVMQFFKASGLCLAAGLIGLAMNLPALYHTWEYQKESMRAGSEIQQSEKSQQSNSGLSHEYITQWSYGGDELMTLMIPNAKGGSSEHLMGDNRKAISQVQPDFQDAIANQFPQYWGEQPFTAGPVYVGAFVVFLFILSLLIVRGPLVKALFVATILSMLLSLGHNLPAVSDFFIDHFPLFSKFRTISSILVIAEFTMPLMGMLALKRLYDEPDYFKKKTTIGFGSASGAAISNWYWLGLSSVLTAGVCLFLAIFPNALGNLYSQNEYDQLTKMGYDILLPQLEAARKTIFTADCWRSFWIIVCGVVLLLIYTFWTKKQENRKMAGVTISLLMAVLCLFDMWSVDKRYLNDKMFVNADQGQQPIEMTQTDAEILKDKTLGYRVFNFASDTFNENETSYYHKSIGGYHAAKLGRYNDVITKYLAPEKQKLADAIYKTQGNMAEIGDTVSPVTNMLNAKYFIVPVNKDENGRIVTAPLQNTNAIGTAWFVDKIEYVGDATSELNALGKLDLRHQAVADKSFQEILGTAKQQDSTAVAKMTAFEPNHVEYEADSKAGGVLVISEVYYPGWTAQVDGKDAEIGRLNYILRGLQLAPGKHKIVLDFHPQTVSATETTAYVAYGILLVALIAAIFLTYRKTRKVAK